MKVLLLCAACALALAVEPSTPTKPAPPNGKDLLAKLQMMTEEAKAENSEIAKKRVENIAAAAMVEPAKPASKPAVKPASKPAVKPASKPAVKPASKPAVKPASKPATKPAAKHAAKPASKPASKPAAKPAVKPAAKPVELPPAMVLGQAQAAPAKEELAADPVIDEIINKLLNPDDEREVPPAKEAAKDEPKEVLPEAIRSILDELVPEDVPRLERREPAVEEEEDDHAADMMDGVAKAIPEMMEGMMKTLPTMMENLQIPMKEMMGQMPNLSPLHHMHHMHMHPGMGAMMQMHPMMQMPPMPALHMHPILKMHMQMHPVLKSQGLESAMGPSAGLGGLFPGLLSSLMEGAMGGNSESMPPMPLHHMHLLHRPLHPFAPPMMHMPERHTVMLINPARLGEDNDAPDAMPLSALNDEGSFHGLDSVSPIPELPHELRSLLDGLPDEPGCNGMFHNKSHFNVHFFLPHAHPSSVRVHMEPGHLILKAHRQQPHPEADLESMLPDFLHRIPLPHPLPFEDLAPPSLHMHPHKKGHMMVTIRRLHPRVMPMQEEGEGMPDMLESILPKLMHSIPPMDEA